MPRSRLVVCSISVTPSGMPGPDTACAPMGAESLLFPVHEPLSHHGQVLGIVYRCIATRLVKKPGVSSKTAQTGAIILIPRLGSTINLNINLCFSEQ